ncbi:MAG: glycine cleavage system aminomethyltransferase GcvT [Acidobacteria bacterium]|nr:glycine cleavage system aminomethyltransferase GcvT [Acidobacteriota bacterium]
MGDLKRTPLHGTHRRLGARMVNFAGWDMPVEYSSVLEEHRRVRQAVGLFDVSHMGKIEIRGPGAVDLVQNVTCNDAFRLSVGQIQYSALTYPEGTFVDDVTVHRLAEDHFLLVVNAANTDKDYQWISQENKFSARVENRSSAYAQFALQGPLAQAVLQKLAEWDLSQMKYYRFVRTGVKGLPTLVSRTGYTGEDGFEIYLEPAAAEALWMTLLEVGRSDEILPVGLGARNTLRLEAKMALYGNDIDHTTTVLEADLGWIVKFDKGSFIGRDALWKQQREGPARRLVGFEMVERGIAREHYPVTLGGSVVGEVTSGSYAPSLGKNIGLTYLPVKWNAVGTEFFVTIRNKPVKARVVPTPFYKRRKT